MYLNPEKPFSKNVPNWTCISFLLSFLSCNYFKVCPSDLPVLTFYGGWIELFNY